MTDSAKTQRLEQFKAKFAAADSVFEPNIYQSVVDYLRNGGTPLNVVAALSDNYVGFAPMCNLLIEEWCPILGIDGAQVALDTVKTLMLERFDPDLVDAKFMPEGSTTAPDWLHTMIHDAFWRSVIYELSEKHPRCLLLNCAIQTISEAGYQAEITSATTASTYFNVYRNVLLETLKKLNAADEASFYEVFADIEKICAQNEHMYLFSQALFKELLATDPVANYPLRRVMDELEKSVARNHNKPEILTSMNVLLAGLPVYGNEVSTAVASIKRNRLLSPGDAVALYNAYQSATPPSVEHLRDIEIIDFFLYAVFLPKDEGTRVGLSASAGGLRPEIREKYLWLLAHIVSSTPSKSTESLNGQALLHPELDTNRTFQYLQELTQLLPSKPTADDLARVTGTVLEKYIDIPILSAAVIVWLRYVLRDDHYHYYETYFRVTEVPLPHLLLEEVAHRHQGLQHRVFVAFKESYEASIQTLGAELMTALQKSILDRMIYLMQLGFAIPVLKYVKQRQDKVDESLTVHFARKILEMVTTPYSPTVVAIFLEILKPIAKTVIDSSEHHMLLTGFIDDIIDNDSAMFAAGETMDAQAIEIARAIESALPASGAF